MQLPIREWGDIKPYLKELDAVKWKCFQKCIVRIDSGWVVCDALSRFHQPKLLSSIISLWWGSVQRDTDVCCSHCPHFSLVHDCSCYLLSISMYFDLSYSWLNMCRFALIFCIFIRPNHHPSIFFTVTFISISLFLIEIILFHSVSSDSVSLSLPLYINMFFPLYAHPSFARITRNPRTPKRQPTVCAICASAVIMTIVIYIVKNHWLDMFSP